MMTDQQFLAETAPKSRDLIDAEVSEALATLRNRYPSQRVGIRLWFEGDGPVGFFASVEHTSAPGDYQCANGLSAHEAVEKLIAEVGDHNQIDATEIKIAQLEDELSKLRRSLASIGAVACGDECTLHAHERGITGEPERIDHDDHTY